MGALSRALTLALSVGLLGCTVKTMPIVGEPVQQAVPQEVAPAATETVTAPVSREYGWLNLSVRWPQQDGFQVALLPTTTNAIAISIKGNGTMVGTPTIVSRQAGATSATASIRVEAATNLSVEIKAYRETNPNLNTAVPIAQKAAAGVNVIRSKATALSLSLDPLNVPTVMAFNRNLGKVGETITVTGTNFGSGTVPTPTVTFNGTPATSVTRISETSLTLVVPEGATSGYVQVKADGVDSNSVSTFWVLSSLVIDPPLKAQWDTTPSTVRMVRYGETLDFVQRHGWVWKSSQDEASGVFGNPPLPTWSTSNAAAGTLDANGRFTAATAYATTSVSASIGHLKSNAFEVRAVGVDGVTLSQSALTLNAKPATGSIDPGYVTGATLSATVQTTAPFNGGVNWSTSNSNLVTVLNGVLETVAGAPEGTAIITARSVDDPSKAATASVTVTILGDLALEIE